MKLSNQRLINIAEFFQILTIDGKDENGNMKARKIPVKLGLAIRKNRRHISPHLEDYQESLKELREQCCELDDEGNPRLEDIFDKNGKVIPIKEGEQRNLIFKSDEDKAAYMEGYVQLLSTKVEVEIHKVTEATIEKMDFAEEYVLAGLEFMIEGWEPEPVASSNGQVEVDA